MTTFNYEIKKEFSYEIGEIFNLLDELRNKHVYEISKNKSDAAIATKTDKIKELLIEILDKVQKGERSNLAKAILEKAEKL